jgi:hypothetical protein
MRMRHACSGAYPVREWQLLNQFGPVSFSDETRYTFIRGFIFHCLIGLVDSTYYRLGICCTDSLRDNLRENIFFNNKHKHTSWEGTSFFLFIFLFDSLLTCVLSLSQGLLVKCHRDILGRASISTRPHPK